MTTNTQEFTHTHQVGHTKPVLKALVIGGLVGAGAMLLLAPQSGRKTRANIQQKTLELRERTAETMRDAISQVKSRGYQIKADVQEKAEELQQRGEDVLVEQLDRVSTAAKAGKKAIKGSSHSSMA